MFLIDRNSHYYITKKTADKYFKDNERRCLEFLFGEFSSTLNFVSERDTDEIVQTHMLS